ncbi:protein-tyrosine phosphatase-like protein [Lasiosphaeria ovina]|uniref:protein-tyrosine-phosphatase n=1 Tax=Lasiosphaeria ovina TaxID=92902 RepID=A0AAE0NAH3_9PEZI|nr:protein-tyrosine phosphatase-like protein [Lasiosphaeria ovina]
MPLSPLPGHHHAPGPWLPSHNHGPSSHGASPYGPYSHGHGHSPAPHTTTSSLTEIEPGLFLGDWASSVDVGTLMRHGITAIVSLGHGPAAAWSGPAHRKLVPAARHLFVACDDSATADLLGRLPAVCDFIDAQLGTGALSHADEVRRILAAEELREAAETSLSGQADLGRGGSAFAPGTSSHGQYDPYGSGGGDGGDEDVFAFAQPGRVLVHCSEGVSRSPTVVVAYLMRKHRSTAAAVLRDVKRRRRVVDPNCNFLEQLHLWEELQYDVWEDAARQVPKPLYRLFLESRAEMLTAAGGAVV